MTQVGALDSISFGVCPDCSSMFEWRLGPRGGISQNVECRQCRSRFNVTVYRGTLVWAERIDNTSNWDELGY